MPMKPQTSREGMRRLCALFLLLLSVSSWLLAWSSPLVITESSLPACCRTHGRHKCFKRFSGKGGAQSTSNLPAFSQAPEPCPDCPAWNTAAHSDHFGPPANDASWTTLSGTTFSTAITSRSCRSFPSHANCKRGPPSPELSIEATTDRLATRARLPLHWRRDASTKTDISSLWYDVSTGPEHAA
jgi:hypothetical protein